MRQTHVAGERLFVDYAGTTLEVINGLTGEVITAQLFVAALGASSYTYAEATWTQGLADWIGSHTRAFAFIGGVTAMVVSDNLKSGITGVLLRAGGEPQLRRDGGALRHGHRSGAAQEAARQGQGRGGCSAGDALDRRQVANRQFFTLTDLNDAIRDCVTALNARVTRHLGTSRRALFDEIERPALEPLPAGTLHVRAGEGMPGWPRLSRGGREALYSCRINCCREVVGAHYHAHGRAVPSRQARRRAPAIVLGPQAHDGARAHARRATSATRTGRRGA